LSRARAAVAVAVERLGVGAAHAIALAHDEVFVGLFWVSEPGDEWE
jgi:hypothetical protein